MIGVDALRSECERGRYLLHLATGAPIADLPSVVAVSPAVLVARACVIAECCERARVWMAEQWGRTYDRASIRDDLREWERAPDTLDDVDVVGMLYRQAVGLMLCAERIRTAIDRVALPLPRWSATDGTPDDGASLVQT